MRRHLIAFGMSVAGLATAALTQAAVAPFDYSYEGDAVPTASSPVWTQNYGGAGTSATVNSSILTLSTDAGTDLMYVVDPAAWSPDSDGTTVETRMKIDSQAGNLGAGDLTIVTGAQAWKFAFRTAGGGAITEVIGGGTFLTGDVGVNPTDGFHTYRFVISGQSGPAVLYIDGNTTPAYSWNGVSTGSSYLNFGDDLGDDAGVVQWDYVAWTNNGAFAPEVPEPSTLALAMLAAVSLMRRRR